MTYNYLSKNIHRATVVELWEANPSLPILYLDEGEATAYFLKRNIPKKSLLPVNNDAAIVASIWSTYKVKGIVGNIDDVVAKRSPTSCAVVWLDYTCRFHKKQHCKVVRRALDAAPSVSLTFSIRALDKKALFSDMLRSFRGVADVLEYPFPYKGKSNYTNMVKLTLVRKAEATTVCEEAEATGHVATDVDSWVGKTIAIPTKLWGGAPIGYDDIKTRRNKFYFRVGTRFYRRKSTFKVYGIHKNGKVCKTAECFTVTAEQATDWVVG